MSSPNNKIELNKIYNMDCLDYLPLLPDNSVDMLLVDLPYGITKNKWDKVIPFDKLWEQYNRIVKKNGALVFTSVQPFTTDLINSNRKNFKYTKVWDKVLCSSGLNAKKQPLRVHEDVVVFYRKFPTYNPQFTHGHERKTVRSRKASVSGNYNQTNGSKSDYDSTDRYPTTIMTYSNGGNRNKISHKTQKPVQLFMDLILTYSNKGDVILDNCMGGGTTEEACYITERNFYGCEIDPEIFNKQNLNKGLFND